MYSFNEISQYSKGLSLLYIEDDTKLLEETLDILDNFFDETSCALNGKEGLEKYMEKKETTGNYFDLIITDINMPVMDGMEMIKRIKKINDKQSIIVISAYNESDRLLDLIHLGIDNFLQKPIDAKYMMKVLYKASKHIFLVKQKDQFLIDQSKLASMGEMIDSIAHQWIQPIHIMKMGSELLNFRLDDGDLDKEDIKEYTNKNITQLNHLTQTLKEFRGFFRPNENHETTTYNTVIESVLILLKDTVILNKIDIKIDIKSHRKISIIPNEFKHVLINIICNAIDAFNDNNIEKRVITISTYDKDDKVILTLQDNAGGIPPKILHKIFEPNFTTKEKGTGVGLYLSSMIVNKIDGKIEVENKDDGACFIIGVKSID